MNMSAYDLIKSLYAPIYKERDISTARINTFQSFSKYVKKVYFDLTNKEYSNALSMTIGLMSIGKSQLHNLILEVIFLNLYEHITLIKQQLIGKGERRESFLYSLDLPEKYSKYGERFRKQMQPARLQPKSIRSFKKVYTTEEPPIKYYIPRFMKAYKDVIFVPRQRTDILDISPYYRDIFKALMYEEESNYLDKEYMRNKELIKSYQIWDFSAQTILQIERIYEMIVKSEYKPRADKTSQLVFVERLFGLVSMSELLKKTCIKDEYIQLAYNISLMTCLGYSNLNKIIIEKINISEMIGYRNMIEEYIYPICTECIATCINEIIYYIGTLDFETRISQIDKFRNTCAASISTSLLVSGNFTYEVTKQIRQIRKYREKNLHDDFVLQLMKALVYQYTNKLGCNEIETCIKHSRVDYTYDYNINHGENSMIFDCGAANVTFGEGYNYDDEKISLEDISEIETMDGRYKY